MNGQKVKRQHYVPRFYLRRFTYDGDMFFVFDKVEEREFRSNIKNVAAENFFFDLPESGEDDLEAVKEELLKDAQNAEDVKAIEEAVEKLRDPQVAEKVLAEIEGTDAIVLEDFLSSIELNGTIDPDHKSDMSFFIANQALRTREHRYEITEMMEKLGNHLLKEYEKSNASTDEYSVVVAPEAIVGMHIGNMFSEKIVNTIAGVVHEHIWIIGKNRSSRDLYTSDNPIARKANYVKGVEGDLGFASPGIELYFPLSSEYILMLLDRRFFEKPFGELENGILELSAMNVLYCNSLQVSWSTRQVYCARKDFGLARNMCRKNPRLRDKDRDRIMVVGDEEKIGMTHKSPFAR